MFQLWEIQFFFFYLRTYQTRHRPESARVERPSRYT